MPTIFDQIVSDIRKREFANANDLIKTALQEKVAQRLAEEKKSLMNEEKEDTPNDGIKGNEKWIPKHNCHHPGNDPDKCPACKGRKDIKEAFGPYKCSKCEKTFKASGKTNCPHCSSSDVEKA